MHKQLSIFAVLIRIGYFVMIKKQAAIFFILLANIILAAHVAVPHHHHKTQVCIESTHCQNDGKPQTNASHNHQHDGENGSNYCLLKQLVILPSNQDKQECKNSFLTDGHSSWDGYQTVLLNHEFQHFIASVVLNIDASLSTPPYIVFINSSLGLRAPPTV